MKTAGGLLLVVLVLPVRAVSPASVPSAPAESVAPKPSAAGPLRVRAATGVYARTVPVFVRYASGVEAVPPGPEDVVIREDGVEARVLSVEPYGVPPLEASEESPAATTVPAPPGALPSAAPQRSQLFYFDATFLGFTSLPVAARAAAGHAATLASRGPVEILVADPSPRRFAGPLATGREIAEAFERLAATPGRDRVLALREAFAQSSGRRSLRARADCFQEELLVRTSLDKLASFVGSRADALPGVLFLVSDGFETLPRLFYGDCGSLDDKRSPSAGADLGSLSSGSTENPGMPPIVRDVDRLVREVTSKGWVFLPWSPSAGHGRGDAGSAAMVVRRSVDDPLLGASGSAEILTLPHAIEPLRQMAEASGSDVVLAADGLARADALLASLYVVTYTVDRARDGGVHRLEVSSLVPGVTIRSPQVVSAGTPEWSAAARARRRAEGSAAEGELKVESSVIAPRRKTPGRIEARVDLVPLLPALRVLGEGRLRVTVAFAEQGREPFVRQETLPLSSEAFAKTWIWEAPVETLPAKGRLVVDVEELATGVFGSASIALPFPGEP